MDHKNKRTKNNKNSEVKSKIVIIVSFKATRLEFTLVAKSLDFKLGIVLI